MALEFSNRRLETIKIVAFGEHELSGMMFVLYTHELCGV